jgi:hypothetical protein
MGGNTGAARPVNQAMLDSSAVFGGSSFIFTLELLNTHREIEVRDLKITITSDPRGATQPGGIFNPRAGSNTFFVEQLGPGATWEDSLELLVRSDAVPDSYGLTITMSYRNENGESTTVSEIINIPVQQEIRFSIVDLPPISEVQLGEEVFIPVSFGNLGRSSIYNVMVNVVGDGFFNMEGTHPAGTIEAGTFKSNDFYLMTIMPGFLSGSFVFTYEDVDGNPFEEMLPFSFFVMGGDDMMGGWDERPIFPDGEFMIDPETGMIMIDPETGMPIMVGDLDEEDEEPDMLMWIIIGAGALALIVVVIVIVVAVKKRRARDEYDDDGDGDEGD